MSIKIEINENGEVELARYWLNRITGEIERHTKSLNISEHWSAVYVRVKDGTEVLL